MTTFSSNKACLRRDIHLTLDLPVDRPLLRRFDCFQFDQPEQTAASSDQTVSSKYLTNPHTSVKPSNSNLKKIINLINHVA
jgi:hypothetical protein